MTPDLSRARKDFPILEKKFNGKPLIYFDNACMTLKPKQVVDAMSEYYNEYPACAGRSAHKLGRAATENYAKARERIAKFIGAKPNEIIFTRNTTEGINLISHSLDFKSGDTVLTTDKEHNSNLLPWQQLREKGVKHSIVNSDDNGQFNFGRFVKGLAKDIKLVSMVHTSNVDGVTIPAKEVIASAHENNSLVLLDAAQSAPHKKIDVKKLGVDFLAFSGHKMLGPTGFGVLYGKYELLEKLKPFMVGGDTVSNSTYGGCEFLKPPEKFEAGLQNYAGAIGMAAAVDYLSGIGMENIEQHEIELNKFVTKSLLEIPGLRIFGPSAEHRSGIISFAIDKMDIHYIAQMLDKTENIAVRSGMHCAHSWFNSHGMPGSVRASLYLYNTKEEAGKFTETVKKIAALR